MFCVYCKFYRGVDSKCQQNKNIYDYKEVLECEHYTYNGEVNEH